MANATPLNFTDRKWLTEARENGVVASIMLSRLTEAGYVERTGSGCGRRGYAAVKLTDAGSAALAASAA